MPSSVVTSGSFTIVKYSRSYPSPLVRTQSQDLGAAQPEWQHFSNPGITLAFDVKKSMDNNFESVRLRVSWNTKLSHDGMEREVTMVRQNTGAYTRTHMLTFFDHIARKTSISCLSRGTPPKSIRDRDHLSKPSIVAPSWVFVISIHFPHLPLHQPYAFEK